MISLYLFRHAKSGGKHGDFNDLDRPLKAKGVADAFQAAKVLQRKKIQPDLLLTSPAVRAVHTALIYAREAGIPPSRLQLVSSLYSGPIASILKDLARIGGETPTVMLFGHEPLLPEIARHFVPGFAGNIPTAGVIGIRFAAIAWSQAAAGRGKLVLELGPGA